MLVVISVLVEVIIAVMVIKCIETNRCDGLIIFGGEISRIAEQRLSSLIDEGAALRRGEAA